MRRLRWALAVILCAPAHAQSAAEVQHSLESALNGKSLPIRGFLGASVIHYAWKTDHLERNREDVYTVGVFQTDSVKVREAGGQVTGITLKGTRQTVLKGSSGGYVFSLKRPVTFEVDVIGLTQAELAKLPSQLFFPDVAAAVEAIPIELAAALPATEKPQAPSAVRPGHWIEQDGAWRQLTVDDNPAAPKVVFSPQPEFSEEARQAKMSGSVLLTMLLTPEGKVGELWLARPLGNGLDEKAIQAAARYRFEPPIYDGKPVGMVMSIEIDFQTF